MKSLFNSLLFLTLVVLSQSAVAWDSVGHRLATSIAFDYLESDTKAQLLTILQQHPRFQQDFIEVMPSSISRGSSDARLEWLLGQASFWPDTARGFPEPEREKFNHSNWHYIDGAWIRGAAQIQGNIYVGIRQFKNINGERASSTSRQTQINNVMTALDFNTHLLADQSAAPANRAVALCWVLHLVADIHQPLHAGSLYSSKLFNRGDRGGNGIATDDGNLHAHWDRAFSNEGLAFHLQAQREKQSQHPSATISGAASDWSLWLAESRELLLTEVYTDAMQREVRSAERESRGIHTIHLDNNYVVNMKNRAAERIQMAGLRLAIWFENELD
ncbi:MAG: hypothetical protein COA96_03365 [SAR86 cluster bacterium]|uniref:S1/P1 Nuclease n=1 Tax=SAR86 cluster bacterium TaxID=2030880 RepID=A0A2A5B7S9_9GAMM|nr:MAG: hypothetical protein COA96_03365 [SAR86 cluster bacterium]